MMLKDNLEHASDKTPPSWHGSLFRALLVDVIPVEFSPAAVDVHFGDAKPSAALPQVTGNPENDDDEKRQVFIEKSLSGADALADGGNGSVELDT